MHDLAQRPFAALGVEQTRRGLAPEPLDRVADRIESTIQDERRTKQMSDWVRDLRKRAEIQIKKDCLK